MCFCFPTLEYKFWSADLFSKGSLKVYISKKEHRVFLGSQSGSYYTNYGQKILLTLKSCQDVSYLFSERGGWPHSIMPTGFKPLRHKLNSKFRERLGLNCIKTMEVNHTFRRLLEINLITTLARNPQNPPLSNAGSTRNPEVPLVSWARFGNGVSHSELSSKQF